MQHSRWPGSMADTPYPAALLRCYQELGDRLPQSLRGRDFPVDIRPGETLAGLLSRLELPPEEVDLALINGLPVGFSRIVRPGDRVSLYPVFESLDISSLTGLRRTSLRRLRFVTDHGLEELAALLAEAGQTVRTGRGISRSELARASREDHRVVMSLAVAGLVADGTTTVEGAEHVDVSFPNFFDLLYELGADVERSE